MYNAINELIINVFVFRNPPDEGGFTSSTQVDYKIYTGETNLASGKGLSLNSVTGLVKNTTLVATSCYVTIFMPAISIIVIWANKGLERVAHTAPPGQGWCPHNWRKDSTKNQKEAPSAG